MKKTIIILFMAVMLVSSLTQAQVQITNTDTYYTRDQMLLANEINESGEPFAEALGYNLDDLDPFVLNTPDSISYTLGIENYEYSRYQLGTVISRSGIGLHMMWSPVIMMMAANEPDDFDGSFTGEPNGYKEDDELIKNIMHFSMLANQMPPAHPWPQYAEFISGDPHLPQPIDPDNFMHDFSTLRWDRSLMDKTLNPGAMGQTLMKQYLWAQDMLSAFHDSINEGIEPNGTITPDSTNGRFDPYNNVFYGGDNADGFIGQVLTAEAINKVMFMITTLAYDGSDLGMVDPATYDPANGIKYFASGIAVTEGMVIDGLPPKADSFTVTDATSELFDQLSFLWGTLNFKNMMDPNNSSDPAHRAYHSVFDGDPFPAAMSQTGMPGPFDLMMGTSKVIFMNLMAMHFNGEQGTFVDESTLSGGAPQPGNQISTVNAGYVTMVLAKMAEEFAGTPLEPMAVSAVNAQASFIVNSLQDNSGGFYNSYTLGTGHDADAKLAVSQAAAARGLYAAYVLTSDNQYLEAANEAYMFLRDNFYSASEMAFKTELGNNMATYTPANFAIIAGALREANLVGGYDDAPAIYVRFFKKVANAMQLSEAFATGEAGNDSDGDGIPFIPEQPDNLPPVFATEATLDITTGINESNSDFINSYSVSNYPNPFRGTTTIGFNLEKATNISIDVYGMDGRFIETIVKERLDAGRNEIRWNAQNRQPGIYYLRFKANDTVLGVKKAVLLK